MGGSIRAGTYASEGSASEELMTPISNVAGDELTARLIALDDVIHGENSWIEDFKGVKVERDGLIEEDSAYDMEKRKLEKTLLEKDVALKAVMR